MEIEMKYGIPTKEIAETIWTDEYLLDIEEEDSREKILMKAAYFDTEDHILSKNDIALRVRMEGSKIVAALKWKGKNEGALHIREEISVPVNDEASLIMPDPMIFRESEIGKEVIGLINGRLLHNIIETNFLRSRLRIDTGKSLMEISLDQGEIITEIGNLPISELEVELFTGERDELDRVGTMLSEKYGLKPEERSKYARGLNFLRGI